MTRASDLARLIGAGATINDGTTITTADNTTQLTLTSTDADASVGPALDLYRNSGSPADSDLIGDVRFQGENDAGETITYANISGLIGDASDGTEDGILRIQQINAGSAINRISVNTSETVINDSSKDLDFRVESDGNANMLFVDGGENRVGIGSNAPVTALHIQGSEPDIFLRRTDLTNKAWRFNVQSSTGDLNIKSRNDDGSASSTSMIIHHDGYVTKPNQPAFLVQPSSQQSDFGNDGNNDTVAFGTERFDVGSNFASNVFTAPITGKYQLNANLYLTNIDSAANYYQVTLITSNRNYFYAFDVSSADADPNRFTFQVNVLADMDASDQAFVEILQVSGSAQTDIAIESYFSGFLVC